MTRNFDQFTQDYNRLLDEAVELTGFDADHFAQSKIQKLRRLFPDQVDAPMDFLDFGCGPGNLFPFFQAGFPRGRYTGTDLSAEMVRRAQSRFPGNHRFHEMGSDEWKNRSYDLIFAAGVFHHIPREEHESLLKDLCGRLKPTGSLVLWEHNPLNPFTRKIVRDCAFDRDAVLIPPRQMKRLFQSLPLQDIRIIFTTFFPKALRFLLPLESWLSDFPVGGQYIALGRKRAP
ncbi:MAG: methyltransferase domain-containing protein [Nitrospinaceae bacterium]|nr:class I SAM-dependent methyltransferase [Nitrospinaceae bacterium]NIR53922.1 class I SAM-dependent methyltransferase [Nitrospinaceae bacterium]NIS84340.1 class I SAM-dependent methyltransferase [Nitrospinaceae bacterium]NIT81143.1 class I SAM-dependent methyltransferase [Nitrospinaceae bacterium]NIU43425.1 class I SAM-dependent methyltransferase [Nitrospinaceae bacterium]